GYAAIDGMEEEKEAEEKWRFPPPEEENKSDAHPRKSRLEGSGFATMHHEQNHQVTPEFISRTLDDFVQAYKKIDEYGSQLNDTEIWNVQKYIKAVDDKCIEIGIAKTTNFTKEWSTAFMNWIYKRKEAIKEMM
ncbi:hypothetical protein PFISCL1PPCAC_7055, partial [Pristionchus fissidentatus]